MISVEAQQLALAGEMDRAQAVAFLDHAIACTDLYSPLAVRLRFVRKIVLRGDAGADGMLSPIPHQEESDARPASDR